MLTEEIERKFLVTGEGWRQTPSITCCQGHLNTNKMHNRIRIKKDLATQKKTAYTDMLNALQKEIYQYFIQEPDNGLRLAGFKGSWLDA
jgi:CYTH domain-containing protein